ncbi:MAG: nodulation protein NfeD [Bacteroidales bacterium]|nr:nodulation protein NfeD [Bacteroidales bacterium]
MTKIFLATILMVIWSCQALLADTSYKKVLKFEIKQNIEPATWRLTQKVFEYAKNHRVTHIILELNTYGGMVDIADSIRSKILYSPTPVYTFINNNAASAGALISIACKKIYMQKGATIGAATVVDQEGKVMPDKYQSYMRSIMRATAEYHGKKKIKNDTNQVEIWIRDPRIAEAMVDPSIKIEGIVDSGKVLSFTANEAMQYGYCDGIAENIYEVLDKAQLKNAEFIEYKPSFIEKIIYFLMNPLIQGLLIMLIIGGIYFELQTPGVGFPLIAAITGAVFYFAPLYLEGLAEHWEILLFIIGIGLLIVEIFVTPGFGVIGTMGIIAVIVGLTLSMVDNIVFTIDGALFPALGKAFSIVIFSLLCSFFLSLYFSQKLFTNQGRFKHLALNTTQKMDEGYIGIETTIAQIVGKQGIAATTLRPSGKIDIDGIWYDAVSEDGLIHVNEPIEVVKFLNNQAYVRRIKKG